MKNVSQATEKRIQEMVKSGHIYGECLKAILDNMKEFEGWYGSSISEMKKFGVVLDNSTEVRVPRCYAPLYNGMSVNFSGMFSASFALGMHVAYIDDFNGLVKAIYENF